MGVDTSNTAVCL